MEAVQDILRLEVAELLGVLAEKRRTPAAGSLAALAAAAAAALVQRCARTSGKSWDGAHGAAAQAGTLVERAAPLVAEDAEAFEHALRQLEAPDSDWDLGKALDAAAGVPTTICELATDVALLAADVAERGNPRLRADAAAAAVLAAAAARMAAHLVEVNLGMAEGDIRIIAARRSAAAAAEASARALG